MKQGKLQNYFDSNVHSVRPASSVLHVASSTEWEEGSETGSPCTLGGSGCNFQDLPGTKTRTKFLVTFFFSVKTGYALISKVKDFCNIDLDRSSFWGHRCE